MPRKKGGGKRSGGGGGRKKGLTPYQGDKRCFGHFHCDDCNRTWYSGNSWADCGQECTRCSIMIYPYKQEKLKEASEADKIDGTKPHPMELCEKCQKLGYRCTQRSRGDDDWYY